jgi:hypothetical protein
MKSRLLHPEPTLSSRGSLPTHRGEAIHSGLRPERVHLTSWLRHESIPTARGMLQHDRVTERIHGGQVAWRLGIGPREYRELVEGEAWPSSAVWERIEEFSWWPQTFVESS